MTCTTPVEQRSYKNDSPIEKTLATTSDLERNSYDQ